MARSEPAVKGAMSDSTLPPDASARSGVQLQKILDLTLLIGAVVVGCYHLGLEITTLFLREPMGFWETVYAARAAVWPDQYDVAHYVLGHDGYGPGYPTFVRPFLWTGLDVYVAHRTANLVAILLAGALIFRLLRKQTGSLPIAVALTVIVYALNAGSYSIQARPDFLVVLQVVAMLALGDAAVRRRLELSWTFAISIGFVALAAVLTKAYAGFTCATVLAFMLKMDWRRALKVSLVTGGIIAIGVLIYASRSPLYVMEVFYGPILQVGPSAQWFRLQLADFSLLTAGIIVAILIGALKTARAPSEILTPTSGRSSRVYWIWQTVIAAVALLAGPAWHTGAYLTYFLHLLLPPLALLAGNLTATLSSSSKHWVQIALLGNLVTLMVTAPSWPQEDKSWLELREDILRQPGRVAVDFIMEPVARERADAILLGSGMTGYALKEPFLIKHDSSVVQAARTQAAKYVVSLSANVFGQKPVDAIYLDCLLSQLPGTRSGFTATPRNEIPIFDGPEMVNYVAVGWFNIAPYYFATNAPRQKTGLAKTTIVKFVRRPPAP